MNVADFGQLLSFTTLSIASGASMIHRKTSSTFATVAIAISIGALNAAKWNWKPSISNLVPLFAIGATMAGDWIKFEISTSEKPEVWAMAQALGIDADAVVGKLLRVWAWFDQQTPDGNAISVTSGVTKALATRYQGVTSGVTKALLDRRVGVSGFCDAMISVGWMIEESGSVGLPNFDRHNGKTAKTRAMTAKRVASHKAKSNASSVTSSVTSALPREEKRRDKEKDKKESSRFSPPTVEEVGEYCASRGNGIDPKLFVDHYEANAWMRGKTKIRDWRACIRTWEARQDKQPEASYGAGGI